MRLSTSTNIIAFDQGRNYAVGMDTSVKVCAEAGYEYLDANLCAHCRPGMPLAGDGWEAWAHGIRALSDSLGVRFTQAHAYWPITYTVHPDGTRTDGELGEELMRRSVIAAEIIGAPWMVVHPLTVFDGDRYSARLSEEYNTAYFGRWAEFYAAHNVGMAIENMNCKSGSMRYAGDPEQLLALIRRIGHPMVGACLDTGHAHLSGVSVPGTVRLLGDVLKATHIADNHQNADEHIAPFAGTIPWADVMRAFRDIGYEHDFSFEIQQLSACYPAEVQTALVRFTLDLGRYLVGMAG